MALLISAPSKLPQATLGSKTYIKLSLDHCVGPGASEYASPRSPPRGVWFCPWREPSLVGPRVGAAMGVIDSCRQGMPPAKIYPAVRQTPQPTPIANSNSSA